MDGNKTVNATFTQIEYTLTITPVGSGSVAKNPDQATYHYGDVVTLTATPVTGWVFSAWSGDLTGSANPTNITMDGNKTVTATFTVEIISYTLTINTVGNGTITPVSGLYPAGTVVDITAIILLLAGSSLLGAATSPVALILPISPWMETKQLMPHSHKSNTPLLSPQSALGR